MAISVLSRLRLLYAVLAISTVAVGLAVHFHAPLPTAARDILGDALWAIMVVWLVSAVAPTARFVTRGSIAFAIAVAVEFGQLYHVPALDAIRGTTVGHLVLGSHFDLRDIAAYGAGVLVALVLDRVSRGSSRT